MSHPRAYDNNQPSQVEYEVTLSITIDRSLYDHPENWDWETILDLAGTESIDNVVVVEVDDSGIV